MTNTAMASLLLGHRTSGEPVRGLVVGDGGCQVDVGVMTCIGDVR